MNEDHFKILEKIVASLTKKLAFKGVDLDDVRQEAYKLGLEAYPRWDGVRPLENFLRVHIHNRLRNYRRDSLKSNRELPLPELFDDTSKDKEPWEISNLLTAKLDEFLPAKYRKDYLMAVAGLPILHHRRLILQREISSIVGQSDGEE